MKLSNILGCGLLMVTLFTACDKDDDDNSLNDTDRNFMMNAAYSNLAEIDAGTLAATKGSKDSVKMYGGMMVTDHTTANTELQALATTKGVSLPTAPDPAHQAMKQMLMGMSGYMFDTAYINGQVKDHQATIALFETEVSQGSDQSTKNFANSKLPALRSHLQMAQTIRGQLIK